MNGKEKEVWDVVLTYTDLIMHGKVDEFIEHFHEDYSGWSNIEPMPADKQSIILELNKNQTRRKTIEQYDLVPIKIIIHEQIAIVHYFLRERFKDQEDLNKSDIKHYTDILIHINERWYLIADHFGTQENKKFENYNQG
jgi:hypothetical protein